VLVVEATRLVRTKLPSGTAVEVARPDGRPRRSLVLIPDIMGLRPLFDDLVARLAREHGWVVAAIEPWPGRETLPLEERLGLVGTIRDGAILGDVRAAADLVAVEPVAVLGFCMGGMYALKAAGLGRFDKAVAFYGMIRVPERWHGSELAEPLDAVSAPGAARVLAIVGGRDQWTPPEDVAALERAGATVVRYPEAEHGFVHDLARPAHRAADAADAWRRAVAFLG
jgi:carboxymethylenebutenolidase